MQKTNYKQNLCTQCMYLIQIKCPGTDKNIYIYNTDSELMEVLAPYFKKGSELRILFRYSLRHSSDGFNSTTPTPQYKLWI